MRTNTQATQLLFTTQRLILVPKFIYVDRVCRREETLVYFHLWIDDVQKAPRRFRSRSVSKHVCYRRDMLGRGCVEESKTASSADLTPLVGEVWGSNSIWT